MDHHKQITAIKAVANALQALNEKIVFTGGATISLYPDKPVIDIRPTDDIDIIMEILNYNDRITLENRLRTIGFEHDIASGIICRYIYQHIVVDVLPTNDSLAGFHNKWYPAGFQNAILHCIDEHCCINILSPVYFIAAKLEAFKGRGNNDGRTSKDFEDIVCVFENRQRIWEELEQADDHVREYVQKELSILAAKRGFGEWLDCHVNRANPLAAADMLKKINSFTRY
ncbi:MAG: nucleotidyl transferase AbiEii/AbiGii toxin family protein [Dinghuibacter sp.]|nr:nucleotidyl transferase AbiEii/AbiGii toxin family protein [Dinghuibacter sp.]